MTELAVSGIPVTVTCRVLRLSHQSYYRGSVSPLTESGVVQAYRANALVDANKDDRAFEYWLLADGARAAGESMWDRTA